MISRTAQGTAGFEARGGIVRRMRRGGGQWGVKDSEEGGKYHGRAGCVCYLFFRQGEKTRERNPHTILLFWQDIPT